MSSYKDPSFQDRVGSAAEAKKKPLERLRSKPAQDEQAVAERQAARLRRETLATEKRAIKKAAEQASKEARAAASAAKAVPVAVPPTEAERKAARDARYAARKSRK